MRLVDDALARVGELGTVGAMKWLALVMGASSAGVPSKYADFSAALIEAENALQGIIDTVGDTGFATSNEYAACLDALDTIERLFDALMADKLPKTPV